MCRNKQPVVLLRPKIFSHFLESLIQIFPWHKQQDQHGYLNCTHSIVSPFTLWLHNGLMKNVTRVIWDKGLLMAIGFFGAAAQPCIKWWVEQACNLINALKTVKMDNEKAKSQMAWSVCLLGTLTAYWSAEGSLGQGQRCGVQGSYTASGTGTGLQDLLGNRLDAVTLSFCWRSAPVWMMCCRPLTLTVSSPEMDDFFFQYNSQQPYCDLYVVWNRCDVTIVSGTLIARGCENAHIPCYWIVIGLSDVASNFTNGAINTYKRISGTIRIPIKDGCASKTRRRAREGKRGGSKEYLTKRWKVCVYVCDGNRERGMVAHSSFLCHKLSWAFACSVFNLSVIWALGWYKVYAAALFKPNHSPWRVILSLTIINVALGIMKHT